MMNPHRVKYMAYHDYRLTITINVMSWFNVRSKHAKLEDYLDL